MPASDLVEGVSEEDPGESKLMLENMLKEFVVSAVEVVEYPSVVEFELLNSQYDLVSILAKF